MTSTQDFLTKNKSDPPTPTKICFICTGNTCRSPMAAAVLNHLGNGKYIAESAGIMADKGAPISEKAKNALVSAGIIPCPANDYNTHSARQLNMGIMDDCDKIVAVGAGHAMMIMQSYPLCASKITSFDVNITDPYGQSQEVYDKCLAEITDCIKNMFALEAKNSGEQDG